MPITTRRVLPKNTAEVKDQFRDIQRRINNHGSLKKGATGDAVKDLQRRLRSFGLKVGPPDGQFGAKTEAAVRAFQKKTGIVVDGVAGPQVLAKLKAKTLFVEDKFETPAKQGQRGVDVKRAERMLKDLGMNPGKVDGHFDADTKAAVQKFTDFDPQLVQKNRIDAQTFARMSERYQQPLKKGLNRAGVRQLEKNLKALGRDPGKVDRNYDQDTKRAVKNFQKANGLNATGVADLKTRQLIQKKVDNLPPPVNQQIAKWNKKAPAHNYTRVAANGSGVINKRTKQMLDRAEYIMRNKFGHKGFSFTIVQGSYNTSVAASGTTHAGGGAVDIRTRDRSKGTVDDMVRALRMSGFAAWSRGRGFDTFTPHIHAIAMKDKQLSSSAKNQVAAYRAGRNGLTNGAPDPDRHLGRPIPKWARL